MKHQLGNFQNSAKRTRNIWKLFIRYCPYRRMSEKWKTPTCAPFVWRDGAMWLSCVDTAHAQIVLLPWRFVLCAENPSHRRYNCSADRGGLFTGVGLAHALIGPMEILSDMQEFCLRMRRGKLRQNCKQLC